MPLPSITRAGLGETAAGYRFPLSHDFPALTRILGDPMLPALEAAFAASLPEAPPTDAGGRLPAFLAATPDLGRRQELVELAAFEWGLAMAARAPNTQSLPPEELDLVPAGSWPAMRLAFHPSLVRVGTEWNAVAIWRAINQGMPPPAPAPHCPARSWAVWRQGGRTRFRPLPPDDAWALDLAMRSQPFETISRALCHWLPPREAAPHAARMLGDWVDAGWVTDLILA
jgi:hypothetical protein